MIYFDSNYILKCYLNEPEAHKVRELAARTVVKYSSLWGKSEFIAGIKRQTREKKLTVRHEKTIFSLFDEDERKGVWKWYSMDEPFMQEFKEAMRGIPSSVFLRTGDALHLFTARYHGFKEIYSHDRHVHAGAAHFGLKALDVLGPLA
ncbi:MAG: type II toxin-antitoxin system VapC family toxin [Verrucomicrobiae bacterium]|nr:type II toxin-antitoxin system VapC family toxin [Verrucomicrobiae bacterium]